MPTQLAEQLAQIAAKSTNPLNLKAQKLAHGQSLLFEPSVAASQDFESLYALCSEGFEELCLLDNRFTVFKRSIFSMQSKSEDRTQMTKKENGALDKLLEDFLGLVGARLLLKPAIKAVEWLVRRFRYVAFRSAHGVGRSSLTFLYQDPRVQCQLHYPHVPPVSYRTDFSVIDGDSPIHHPSQIRLSQPLHSISKQPSTPRHRFQYHQYTRSGGGPQQLCAASQ